MTSLQTFQFQSTDVRTTIIDGEPWFVVSDVCEYFGVTNRNRVMQGVEAEDKGGTQINTPGGKQHTVTVNESGLYSILFALQPTKARGMTQAVIDERVALIRNFKRWVTKEVIPSIRRTGSYGVPAIQQESDDLVLARGYGIAMQRLTEAREQLAIAAPKVAAFNTFLGADNDYDVRDAAGLLSNQLGIKIGRNQLFDWLRGQGWISPIDDRPYQRYLNNDWLGLKVSTFRVHHSDGTTTLADPQLRITPKGLDRILKVMTKQAQSPAAAPAVTARSSKRRSLNP